MNTKKLFSALLILILIVHPAFSQNSDVYKTRQNKLLQQIDNGLIVMSSRTSNDRLNKDFYYLTGIEEADVTIVLSSQNKVLFNRSGNWGNSVDYPAMEVFKSSDFQQHFFKYLNSKTLYVSFKDFGILNDLGRGISAMESIKNIDPLWVGSMIDKKESTMHPNLCAIHIPKGEIQ